MYCSNADPHPPCHFDAVPDPVPTRHFDADLGPACHFNADPDPDPDPAFHFDAVPDRGPDPSFQIKAQNFEKLLQQAHFLYIFWLVICNLMWIRIQIQLITLMRIRILPFNMMRIHNTGSLNRRVYLSL